MSISDIRLKRVEKTLREVDWDTFSFKGERIDPTNCPVALFIQHIEGSVIPVVDAREVTLFDGVGMGKLGTITLPPAASEWIRKFDRR